MIPILHGPFAGVCHDSRILRESGLDKWLAEHCQCPDTRTKFCIYGDPAFRTSEFIYSPFPYAVEGSPEAEFNKKMGSVREAVEWGFKVVVSNWAFLDFKKNLKVLFFHLSFFTS
jgi:hypothetical protein